MARPIRVEFEGAVYHVTARGNERRLIYRGAADRGRFLETLEEAVQEHGLRIHAYCLMPNHYHLLVETPRGNLSRAIGWLQTTYSIRFNRRHRRSGHLFQGRFKAHLVEADSYAMELLRYVHLNPVRPRDKTLVIPAERREEFSEYPWSSHPVYAGRKPAPSWLCTDWLSFFAPGRKEAQRRYRRFLDDAFGSVVESPWATLRLGLVLGGEEILERARELLRAKPGEDEVRWMARLENGTDRIVAGQILAQEQRERAWQVWVRVRLGA
jgi:REP element-mobilizing transposase RayT